MKMDPDILRQEFLLKQQRQDTKQKQQGMEQFALFRCVYLALTVRHR